MKKAEKWKGKVEWCPVCEKYLPLTDEYFFTYTLVRTGRKGDISRLRLNCRFCQADIDATRRKTRRKERKKR